MIKQTWKIQWFFGLGKRFEMMQRNVLLMCNLFIKALQNKFVLQKHFNVKIARSVLHDKNFLSLSAFVSKVSN
jgi:hypothetical protein